MLPSNIAWTMSTVTTGYAAFILTESATVLGLVSVAMGVPMLLFSQLRLGLTPEVNALGTVILVAAGFALGAAGWLLGRGRRRVAAGVGAD